jgi:hypothetical protein
VEQVKRLNRSSDTGDGLNSISALGIKAESNPRQLPEVMAQQEEED